MEGKKVTKRSILRVIKHLLPELLLNKTEVCKHEHGCFENTIRHAFKRFCLGYGLQFVLKNILLLAKPSKMLKNL